MENPTSYNTVTPITSDAKKIDGQIWELCKLLYRVESVANLAVYAIEVNGDDSQFYSDLNGALQSITDLCKKAQDTLELGIERPIQRLIASENNAN